MALQSLSIRDMAVYQNGTAGWQVDSAFDVTVDTKNPNTVAGCFTTIRRVVVRVEYKGQAIVQQDVPGGFGLKPRRSRPVTMALQGQQFPLTNPVLGPHLQAEMERGNVTMDIYFYARYLRNDRLVRWKKCGCVVVASAAAPSNSSSSLLSKNCYPV